MKRSNNIYADKELINLRKQHKMNLSHALRGMKITEVQIDRIWTRKLRNMNIVEEFFNGK